MDWRLLIGPMFRGFSSKALPKRHFFFCNVFFFQSMHIHLIREVGWKILYLVGTEHRTTFYLRILAKNGRVAISGKKASGHPMMWREETLVKRPVAYIREALSKCGSVDRVCFSASDDGWKKAIIECRGNVDDGRTEMKGRIAPICTRFTLYFLSLSLSCCLPALAEWKPCHVLDYAIEMDAIDAFVYGGHAGAIPYVWRIRSFAAMV